jgi:hypothetical protein
MSDDDLIAVTGGSERDLWDTVTITVADIGSIVLAIGFNIT